MNTVAALLIFLTGAIPMNYLEAKQRLVEDSGHAELVTASITGDFSDHAIAERPKAKNYLNDANRRIEESLVELQHEQHAIVRLAAGQYEVNVPDVRYVSAMQIQKDDGTISFLRRVTGNWLADFYKKLVRLIDVGLPLYWTRGTTAPSVFTSLSTGVDGFGVMAADDTHVAVLFETSQLRIYNIVTGVLETTISTGGAVDLDNNEVYVATSSGLKVYSKAGSLLRSNASVEDGYIRVYNGEVYVANASSPAVYVYDTDGNFLRSWTLSGWIAVLGLGVTADGVVVTGILSDASGRLQAFDHYGNVSGTRNTASYVEILSATTGKIYTASPSGTTLAVYDFSLTATTGASVSLDATPYGRSGDANSTHIFVLTRGADGYTYIESFSRGAFKTAGFIIAPPTDVACNLKVTGGYYARAFVEDEDETWVSANAPNALILMAQAYIELKLHNNWGGFKQFEAQALREASERWANVVYEQASLGRPISEQRLGPASFGEMAPGRTAYDPYSGGRFEWVDS